MCRDVSPFRGWAGRAAQHIRFPGDRPAVQQELLEHMEDRCKAFLAEGMTLREAEAATLAAMGDADETGRELAKVHKPWLGRLYKAAKWFVAVSAVLAFMSSCGAGFDFGRYGFDEPFQTYAMGSDGTYQRTVTFLYPEAEDVCCGYTLSLPVVMHRQGQALLRPEDDGYLGLVFVLEAAYPLPWAGYPNALRESIYAVDSLGNIYPNRFQKESLKDDEMREVCGNPSGRTLFRYRYEMWVSYLHPDAEWVELRYERLNADFSLRIHLPEGGGAA